MARGHISPVQIFKHEKVHVDSKSYNSCISSIHFGLFRVKCLWKVKYVGLIDVTMVQFQPTLKNALNYSSHFFSSEVCHQNTPSISCCSNPSVTFRSYMNEVQTFWLFYYWDKTKNQSNKHTHPNSKYFHHFMFIMFIHTNVTTFLRFTHETVRNIFKKIKNEKQLRK